MNKNLIDFDFNTRFRGRPSAAQEMLTYLYDVLEDFICGPDGEEEWKEYHKKHEKERREKAQAKKDCFSQRSENASHMRRLISTSPYDVSNTVFIKYHPTEKEIQKGADPDPKDYGLEEEGGDYIECETGGGLWMYSWYVSDNIRDDAPADIYEMMIMNFETFYHAPRWYRRRADDSTDIVDYTTYFHYMTGAMKGVSNATMGCVSRYGFKMLLPDWTDLPEEGGTVLMPKVTLEYNNFDFNPDRVHVPFLPFGFIGVCWNKDQPYDEAHRQFGYVSTANPYIVESFPAARPRYKSPDYPNADNFPGPLGPDLKSKAGLAMQTMDPHLIPEDPDPKGTGFHRPKWWNSSGLAIDGGEYYEHRGWDGSIMRVNCGGGLRIDKETGCVVTRVGNSLYKWPICIEPGPDDKTDKKTYCTGGIGIDMQNIERLRGIFDNLDTCDTLIKVAKCLEKIKNIAPCL